MRIAGQPVRRFGYNQASGLTIRPTAR